MFLPAGGRRVPRLPWWAAAAAGFPGEAAVGGSLSSARERKGAGVADALFRLP